MTSPKYRCDAPPTELWSQTLGARSICFLHIFCEKWNDVKYIWNNHMWTVVVFCRGHRFESCWSPDFYRILLSKCLNWKINCNDHLHFHLPLQFTFRLAPSRLKLFERRSRRNERRSHEEMTCLACMNSNLICILLAGNYCDDVMDAL